jgi:hypothetical protein
MKRLNQRQQEHLNRKFSELCDQFLEQEYKKLSTSGVVVTMPIEVRLSISRNGYTYVDYDASKDKIIAKAAKTTPQGMKLVSTAKKLAELSGRINELKAKFRERILFSSNDFEETNALFAQFVEAIK